MKIVYFQLHVLYTGSQGNTVNIHSNHGYYAKSLSSMMLSQIANLHTNEPMKGLLVSQYAFQTNKFLHFYDSSIAINLL